MSDTGIAVSSTLTVLHGYSGVWPLHSQVYPTLTTRPGHTHTGVRHGRGDHVSRWGVRTVGDFHPVP